MRTKNPQHCFGSRVATCPRCRQKNMQMKIATWNNRGQSRFEICTPCGHKHSVRKINRAELLKLVPFAQFDN